MSDVCLLKCFKTFFFFFFISFEVEEDGVRVVGGVVLATGAYIPEISRGWK